MKLVTLIIATLLLTSCAKSKKGTLEKMEYWTASGSKYYSAKVMADNPPAIKGQEYEDPSNSPSRSPNYYYYYWADKSPKDLGYTEGPHTDSDGKTMYYATSSGKTAGSNGHWGSGSSSSSSSSSSGATKYDGIWKRNDGVASYLKLGGTSAKVCSGGSVTNGTFNSSAPSATFTVSGQTHVFTFSISNGLLYMDVPPTSTNPNHVVTEYIKTTAWPC
ncbi:MAG: hypothetical protein ABL940_04300 [Bacteroidia bacterium]